MTYGLYLVAFAIPLVSGALDRIQHPQKSHGFVAIALAGKSHGHPGGGMRVLPAVFPHAQSKEQD
jgi:hypothetical protein